MTRTEPPHPAASPPATSRRLIAWPLLLAGLTLALLLITNAVSAWDDRDGTRRRWHAEHVLEHALDAIDATSAQREGIREIVFETLDALQGQRVQHGEARETMRALLTAETVDRPALERLRSEQLALADETSRLVVDRVADVLEMLTPEQRQTLRQQLERFAPGRHGHPPHGAFGRRGRGED